jgi:hypothetical protein
MSDIALLLYGHSRSFYNHITSYQKNIIDVCDCDVLIHTWDKLDGGYSQVIKDQTLLELSKENIEKLSNVKNLVKLEIESEALQNDANDIGTSIINSCPNQLIRFKAPSFFLSRCLFARTRARKILEEHEQKRNKKYEFVILSVFDICIQTKIDPIRLMTRDTLFMTHASRIQTEKMVSGGRLIYGDRKNIDVWLNMYESVNDLYSQKHKPTGNVNRLVNPPTTTILMEHIAYDTLIKSGVLFDDIALTYDLIRLNGQRIRYDHVMKTEKMMNKFVCKC